jgi:hypothetical protein
MQLLKLSMSAIPIWIKLFHLPFELWNTDCLSHVASVDGTPLLADLVTEEQMRLGFAKVLVEVNVDSEFPREIELDVDKEKQVVVAVEYPWVPDKCTNCKVFGHLSYACDKKEIQRWQSKQVVKKDEEEVVIKKDKNQDGWKVVGRKDKGAGNSIFFKSGAMQHDSKKVSSFVLLAQAGTKEAVTE